jgi:hypothetical protein
MFWNNPEKVSNLNRRLFLPAKIYLKTTVLKVDGNEKKRWVGKDIVPKVLYGIVAIEGYFDFERVLLL